AFLVGRGDVAGAEPVAVESGLRFFGAVPVAVKDAGAADQEFAIGREAAFDIRQRLADSAELVRAGKVERDDGRSFGEAVAFEDANADGGVPLREVATERRAAGDEDAAAPAEAG